jgi:hypothetical protein
VKHQPLATRLHGTTSLTIPAATRNQTLFMHPLDSYFAEATVLLILVALYVVVDCYWLDLQFKLEDKKCIQNFDEKLIGYWAIWETDR